MKQYDVYNNDRCSAIVVHWIDNHELLISLCDFDLVADISCVDVVTILSSPDLRVHWQV